MVSVLSDVLQQLRNRHFLLIDLVGFAFIPLLALNLRLDGAGVPERHQLGLIAITVVFIVLKLVIYLPFGLYQMFWRYASIDELSKIATLTIAVTITQILVFSGLQSFNLITLPRSLPYIDGLLTLLFVGGIRFSFRVIDRFNRRRRAPRERQGNELRALIIGAGDAGVALVRDLEANADINLVPVAFIDDDPKKLGHKIQGLTVAGNRCQIPEVIDRLKIKVAIIAMPSANGLILRDLVSICHTARVETQTLPPIQDILSGPGGLQKSLREVQIEDLLRREPINTDIQRVRQLLEGKRVLLTGAGGSIGSELCRQVYDLNPKEMILLGHGENSVFNIQQELHKISIDRAANLTGKASLGTAPLLTPVIADLRHPARLRYVFEQLQPEVIFHAAAHKHVPLMEDNPPEAVTNNVLGTKALLDLAIEYDVDNFVMISTDKAVNPTNVMGASKRVAEMLVLQAAKKTRRPFVVVRFGNVLGSRGSVIPTFKRQIAQGGPVTVTHPEMCRYFMTIPEAVQLVLQAAVLSLGGEVLMLNMGEPVKIVDLANDLICLSGYEVGEDIKICFTGLRPGEKLCEELFLPDEEYQQTEHEKVLVVKNASHNVSKQLMQGVADLSHAAAVNDSAQIRLLLSQLVAGYCQPQVDASFRVQAPTTT
ncbi:MAG: polysaccharide biosynthesis protein [Thermosynechococcaceae cyanobacterium]